MYTMKPLVQGSVLTTGATIYFTVVGAGVTVRITQMAVTNSDVASHTFTLYLRPSIGVPVLADTIIIEKVIQPKETWVPYQALGFVLVQGATIQALASANGVLILKSAGIEVSS